jgi:hypothetical protein
MGTGLAVAVGVNNPSLGLLSSETAQPSTPLQDEWGIFDPERAGLEALLRKLTSKSKAKDTMSPATSAVPVSAAK